MIEISIVIPTHNHAAFLGRCLMSLCEQTLDPSRYEICVIDNRSNDQTPQVIDLVMSHYPKHKIIKIYEPKLGLSLARNRGFENTSAPLIAYGDDDTTMPPDWVERFINVFAEHSERLGKVGGNIMPVWGAPRPEWLQDDMLPVMNAASGWGNQPHYVTEALFVNNGCYHRVALQQAGLFSSGSGNNDTILLSNKNIADVIMHQNGWGLYYDPNIAIHRTLHANHVTPTWARQCYFWHGVAEYAARAQLQSKGYKVTGSLAIDMPFDRTDWAFINDINEVPTLEKLNRLRSLGYVLASSGFIPT